MMMAVAQIEDDHQEASHREEEDHLVSRWNSQKTPAFPLPLGLVSPKYPKRQVSVGLKGSSPEKGDGPCPMMASHDAPPLPPPRPIGPISNMSFPPKIPMRKSSTGIPFPSRAISADMAGQMPTFPAPLRTQSYPPKYPIRQKSVGYKLHAADAPVRPSYRANRTSSLSPTRRVDSCQTA